MERSVASIRERLTTDSVELKSEDYVVETDDLIGDTALRRAVKLFACEDGQILDPRQFVKGMARAVTMDMILPVLARNANARLALEDFLNENLELKSGRGWNDRYGSLVVKAIMKGIQSVECLEHAEARVSVAEGMECDPDIVWRTVKESGQG